MDLFGGYLLLVLILFAGNIALLAGDFNLNKVKIISLDILSFIIIFILMNASIYLKDALSILQDYFGIIFLMMAVIIFIAMLIYTKNGNLKISICVISLLAIISIIFFSSQTALAMFDMLAYSLIAFVILFVVYHISKLLHHAKRQYPIIVGEYMCLFSVLMFIFALTYDSTRTTDYSMFSSFLILTPVYQLIYVVIAIVVILVIGVLINDNKEGNS